MALILTWNPERWDFPSGERERYVSLGPALAGSSEVDNWSVGRRRHGIEVGDRVFLLRQGSDRRGIVAAGWVESGVYLDEHWDADAQEDAAYVDVQWSCFVDVDERVSTEELLERIPDISWNNVYSSGQPVVSAETGLEIEKLWSRTGDWALRPGSHTTRELVASIYGGATQGGIEPARTTGNLFVYSDPESGHQHGYVFDGWDSEKSVFLYTGEGRVGDQQLIRRNRSLLRHAVDRLSLRLFVAEGRETRGGAKRQRYVGTFDIDDKQPYVYSEASDDNGTLRQVIVFRLRPATATVFQEKDRSRTGDAAVVSEASSIPTEAVKRSKYDVSPTSGTTATKQEADLSDEYEQLLVLGGARVTRWKLRPVGCLYNLYTDLYDHSRHELFEAKASARREHVRSAVGQLLDYRRLLPKPEELRMAVLLPSRPTDDLLAYLSSLQIGCVYRDASSGKFVRV